MRKGDPGERSPTRVINEKRTSHLKKAMENILGPACAKEFFKPLKEGGLKPNFGVFKGGE